MSHSLYWMQSGGCGGDTMSLLSAETPDLISHLDDLDIELLWHPSLSNITAPAHEELIDQILTGQRELDILCIEGAVIRGPAGTGMYDLHAGAPLKNLISNLAYEAKYVVAVGTCASFGGIGADTEAEATGLQFSKWEKGGFLGADFVSRCDLPVINLPGCPCHCDVVQGTLSSLVLEKPMKLTDLNTPMLWYGMLIHQGCTRNEYHEYRVEDRDFGERGCLFFHMGCHGPLVYGPCNKLLWNQRSTKTRVGVPCFGCTQPDFPQAYPFFHTRNIEGVPRELPHGVDRAHYLAYKSMAAAAAPRRLKDRKTRV